MGKSIEKNKNASCSDSFCRLREISQKVNEVQCKQWSYSSFVMICFSEQFTDETKFPRLSFSLSSRMGLCLSILAIVTNSISDVFPVWP